MGVSLKEILSYRLLKLILSCSLQSCTEDKRPQSNLPFSDVIIKPKLQLNSNGQRILQETIQRKVSTRIQELNNGVRL